MPARPNTSWTETARVARGIAGRLAIAWVAFAAIPCLLLPLVPRGLVAGVSLFVVPLALVLTGSLAVALAIWAISGAVLRFRPAPAPEVPERLPDTERNR